MRDQDDRGKWIINSYYQELPLECGFNKSGSHSFGSSFIWVMAIGYPLSCHPDEGGISVFIIRYFLRGLDSSFACLSLGTAGESELTGKWITNSYDQ